MILSRVSTLLPLLRFVILKAHLKKHTKYKSLYKNLKKHESLNLNKNYSTFQVLSNSKPQHIQKKPVKPNNDDHYQNNSK